MLVPTLFNRAAALDVQRHAAWRLDAKGPSWRAAASLNAVFLTTQEFAEACSDYAIVFVPTAGQGQTHLAPIAVLGTQAGENLYLEGKQWRARHVPALLQAYPFAVQRRDTQDWDIVIDEAWEGWSQSQGTALFQPDGSPSETLEHIRQSLQALEVEVQRTRVLGELLTQHQLLRDMRFEAQASDGQKITLQGFLAVDENKLAALSDTAVLALHRSGALGLIHAHQISMRHMRRLMEWRVARSAASNATAAAPDQST